VRPFFEPHFFQLSELWGIEHLALTTKQPPRWQGRAVATNIATSTATLLNRANGRCHVIGVSQSASEAENTGSASTATEPGGCDRPYALPRKAATAEADGS
jgi:hypothetical protein